MQKQNIFYDPNDRSLTCPKCNGHHVTVMLGHNYGKYCKCWDCSEKEGKEVFVIPLITAEIEG